MSVFRCRVLALHRVPRPRNSGAGPGRKGYRIACCRTEEKRGDGTWWGGRDFIELASSGSVWAKSVNGARRRSAPPERNRFRFRKLTHYQLAGLLEVVRSGIASDSALVDMSEKICRGRMKRLPVECYRGPAFVHWSMTISQRRTGWLTAPFHQRFREIQLHTLSRYRLLSLVYCLMPDHMHMLWAGLASESDQDKAAEYFRKYLNKILTAEGYALQKQPWDMVLRDQDMERSAVEQLLFYITQNPERADLTSDSETWEYSGSQAAGYPDLDWRSADFTKRLWTIYEGEIERNRRLTIVPVM